MLTYFLWVWFTWMFSEWVGVYASWGIITFAIHLLDPNHIPREILADVGDDLF